MFTQYSAIHIDNCLFCVGFGILYLTFENYCLLQFVCRFNAETILTARDIKYNHFPATTFRSSYDLVDAGYWLC